MPPRKKAVEPVAEERATPESFNDLTLEELVKAADDFAVNLDEDEAANELSVRAALEESGVTWQMFAEAAGIATPAPVVEEPVLPRPVDDWNEEPLETEVKPVREELVTVPEVPVFANDQKYLVKFVGSNPYFEAGKYRFTQDRPYAVVGADDAQDLLEAEPDKFRQAYPREVAEFYR